MPSHARHGSGARPEPAPHVDARYQDAPYQETGYDDGSYGGSSADSVYDHATGHGHADGSGSPADGYGYGYAPQGHTSQGHAAQSYAGTGYPEPDHDGRSHASHGSHASPGGYATDASYGSYDSYDDGAYASYDSYDDGAYASPASSRAASAQAAADSFGGAPRRGGNHGAATGQGPRPSRAQARAAARARTRRKRRMRNGFLGVGSVAAVAVIAVAGFMNPHHGPVAAAQSDTSAVPVAGRTGDGDASRSVDRATPAAALKQLPGLGKAFLAKIPSNTQQVLLVTGKGKNQNTGTAVLYTRTAGGGWLAGPSWAARNAKDGWTTDHHAGDLHSPIGVYSLTDAGGLDANPGTKLPYLRSSAFQAPGTGFEGESLADAFDYVVAINYNHIPGTSPLSPERPMGASRGGGIWVHVDHGGPTHGCVALAKSDMRALLQALDPAKHPVIVMGDAASLAQ
ncbi:L,D-peptidoglycan transpeptidase YkuD (ErfK/YbiS/YcfS/YnhG family) [Streptacidiphilus sp. MAP12-33]|uniref:L,D-transpeptidase family protein n=1 Tax=Streptacidiphilus sp. MAP12-33 TaxID=3156266 RepID=UPI0035154E62